MADPLLSLTSVTCARGGFVVLPDVTFDVAPGDAITLKGPNGSGKTTLLRTIAGLQPPVSGLIEGDDEDLAYAAHADGIKGQLTVAENLMFWAGLFGQSSITPALDAFELSDLQSRMAQALSAGQKRRLGLARMAVTGRKVWLMDEPTVSLDAHAVTLFADCIRAHLAGGGAAVIATHIDLGLEARTIDVSEFKPKRIATAAFDEAFE